MSSPENPESETPQVDQPIFPEETGFEEDCEKDSQIRTLEDTVEDLRLKLQFLEAQFLGQSSTTISGAPQFKSAAHISYFGPKPTVLKKVEEILSPSFQRHEKPGTQTKLPLLKLPEFSGLDLEEYLDDFQRWLRLSGVLYEDDQVKMDWLLESCSVKVKPIVKKLVGEQKSFGEVLRSMSKLFPKLENDLSLRQKLDKVPGLPHRPEPAAVAQLFVDVEEILGKMSAGAMSDQEKFITLSRKIHPKTYSEMREDRLYKGRTETFADLKSASFEKAEEDWLERNIMQLKRENVHTLGDPDSSSPTNPGALFGKGKGGKGKPFGSGKGKGGRGKPPRDPNTPLPGPHFGVTLYCKHCSKKGHYDTNC